MHWQARLRIGIVGASSPTMPGRERCRWAQSTPLHQRDHRFGVRMSGRYAVKWGNGSGIFSLPVSAAHLNA